MCTCVTKNEYKKREKKKEHLRISKITKIGREMLQNQQNIAVRRSLQILYDFLLRAEVLTTFDSKVVIFFSIKK